MNAVAYCRVSTNKNEQLDSLDAQQNFFLQYAKKNGYNLIHIYAEEGKSGTKMKNRTQLLQLLSDAKLHLFDTVLIKDISRLARNTVDFLISIRKLRALGIRVLFLNYDHTSSDSSEFMLTLLSAIAQEESANTSKRVKFGKELNAKKGRVPNLVYGYDKTPGDYFNLSINQAEAAVVGRIFSMYTEEKIGAAAIAKQLNLEGITTKRNCQWSQNAIRRILHNEIYTGKIINGREEVKNFLTGQRTFREKEKWFVVDRPQLAIISPEQFTRAQVISSSKECGFSNKQRTSHKHPFSQLLVCSDCGYSFRRHCSSKNPSHVRWICSGRNANGADSCTNQTSISEEWLLTQIRSYVVSFLLQRPVLFRDVLKALLSKRDQAHTLPVQDLITYKKKLLSERDKYIKMYRHDIITIEELSQKNRELSKKIQAIEKTLSSPTNPSEGPFSLTEEFFSLELFKNPLLRQILKKITVTPAGKIEVFLNSFEKEISF